MSGAPVFTKAGDILILAAGTTVVLGSAVGAPVVIGGTGLVWSAVILTAGIAVFAAHVRRVRAAACRALEEDRRLLREAYQAGKAERARRASLGWQPARVAALEWEPDGEVITGVTVEVLRPEALPRGRQ